ncbi:MAG: VWA domain-containing protein [Deltaproteobacteria bacterium]|nr:VWA domain-containing protein [Deltaproteobacteria bacterium]
MRRLPVYLVLDVSGSMFGEPIEAVKAGVLSMQSALRKDPQALESAYISVLTFSDQVKQVVELTEVAGFTVPELKAGGSTSLGLALKEVTKCANAEVTKTTASEKGDWKPMVFIMTDGTPTDDITSGLSDFKAYKWGVVVACAAGSGARTDVLTQIAGENVVVLETADSNSIAAFFRWVSSSISTTSKKVESGSDLSGLNTLPPPPSEISLFKN